MDNNTNSRLEKIVDKLDEKTTVEFYQNLKNADNDVDVLDIEESNLVALKTEIKRALALTPYEDVQKMAPKAIVDAIEAISEYENDDDQNYETLEREKSLLLIKLTEIVNQKDSNGRIPPLLKNQFCNIVKTLNETYKLSFVELSNLAQMNRGNLKNLVDRYRQEQLLSPDPKIEGAALTKAERTLARKVSQHSDLTIENDLKLGGYLREKYTIPGLSYQMNLMQLCDSAIPFFLNQKEIYTQVMEIKRNNEILHQEVKILKQKNRKLSTENTNLFELISK